MSWKRDKLKKELQVQLETELDEMLARISDDTSLTLSEIEEMVLKTRQQMGQAMTQALADVESQAQAVEVNCEQCGRKMQNKGRKNKQVTAQSGELEVERNYYYCPTCREGFFPPG
jgi:uncharacterized protein with PIN domain